MKKIIIVLMFLRILCGADIDSLKNSVDELTGKPKYNAMIGLSEELYGDNDSLAFFYIDKAIKYAEDTDDPVMLMKARSTKGDIYFHASEYRKSGAEYKASLLLAEELRDQDHLFDNFKQLGAVAYYLGDYKTSLIFYLKSLELAEEGKETDKAHIFNDLGSLYDEIEDYEKAHDYLDKAMSIYQKHNTLTDVAKVLNNKATVFTHQGSFSEAYDVLKRSLAIYENGGEEFARYTPIVRNNMASILINMGKYNQALKLLERSSSEFESFGDNFGLALSFHEYGRAYFLKKQFRNSKKYSNKSLELSEQLQIPGISKENYKYIAKADSALGRFKSSLINFRKYYAVKESLLDQQKQKEISEVLSKYEMSQKEKQNYLLIRDNEIKRLEIEKQRQINNFFIVLFIMLAGILYLIYRSYKLKSAKEEILHNYSDEIENMNTKLQEEVEKTRNELNESNNKLMKSQKDAARLDKMASLGSMVAGITHEIKNPTQVIKLSMDNLRLSLNDLAVFIYELIKINRKYKRGNKEIKALVEKHRITKLFNDLKNLVISNKKSVELIDRIVMSTTKISRYERDTTDNLVNEIIKDVMTIMNNSIKYSAKVNLELETNIPKFSCNYQEIAQILINLLSNAKDAVSEKELTSDEGLIKIHSGVDDGSIFIEVSDNGTGMDDEQKQKAFDAFYTTKPTGKGQGLGLSIVKNIVDIYKGNIQIISSKGEGTTFRINFPLEKGTVNDNKNSEKE